MFFPTLFKDQCTCGQEIKKNCLECGGGHCFCGPKLEIGLVDRDQNWKWVSDIGLNWN